MKISTFFLTLIILSSFNKIFSQDIFINKDTTINNTWNIPSGAIIKFGSKGHIGGKGTIRGGIIDAALGQWIFDTTLTLNPEGTYGTAFSAKWFGAGRVKDNSVALQKGINTILGNPETLRDFIIPKGVYDFSKPLIIQSIYKGQYVGATIHLYGESSFWDCCNGTTLRYTATNGFAIGLQVAKGTEINNVAITGQFKAPAGNDSTYYNIPFDKYNDANGKCGLMYAGIVIDYDGSKNISGSTGVKIHDVYVGNFSIDFLVSPNGKTFNADILIFENIHCGDARVGFAGGQAQEKGNVIRGIYSWGNMHTLICIGRYGKSQAGHYIIDGGNVAGRCIRLFEISQAGWFASSITNIFSESLGTIGTITTQLPTSISNCTFDLMFPEQIGKQNLFYSDNAKTKFSNCMFRYYGSNQPMKFTGYATYDNCFFSGPVVN